MHNHRVPKIALGVRPIRKDFWGGSLHFIASASWVPKTLVTSLQE